jgi:hypothetical protein
MIRMYKSSIPEQTVSPSPQTESPVRLLVTDPVTPLAEAAQLEGASTTATPNSGSSSLTSNVEVVVVILISVVAKLFVQQL